MRSATIGTLRCRARHGQTASSSMAASSCGFDDSPTNAQMSGWEIPGNGFKYPNGSIFQRLAANGIPYRIYNDASPHPPHHSLYSSTRISSAMRCGPPTLRGARVALRALCLSREAGSATTPGVKPCPMGRQHIRLRVELASDDGDTRTTHRSPAGIDSSGASPCSGHEEAPPCCDG
jgi:hypothetical protein